jgi:E3 ubiquitin-protein ligase RAD18
MYKDPALRKKMSDLGISSQGPRTLLERRHKEWMTIWNSNCDAAQPRKHRELLQDLETWEKTQGGRAPTTGRSAQNAAIIKDKDFDGAAWAAKHDASFQDLINQARKTRLEAKSKAEAAAEESKAKETVTSLSQEPSNFIGLPSSMAEMSADPSSYTAVPNGHSQMPPQPQFAVSHDSNMDVDNQGAYSYRDVLPHDPALGQTWSQNTGNNS